MKVAYFTQWYLPEPTGPAVWIAEGLASLQDVEIEVITANPNYPTGIVYPGYSAYKVRKEILSNVSVTHTPVFPSHDRNPLGRIINYLSFVISASLFGLKGSRNAELLLVYSSPATVSLPAILARKLMHKPVVIIIQDLWPDVVVETGLIKKKLVLKVLKFILNGYDRFMLRNVDQIIVISDGMKKEIEKRGVPATQVTRIYNWTNESFILSNHSSSGLRSRFGIPIEAKLFLYAGNIGSAQGLLSWIRAISELRHLEDLYFVFLGRGTERVELETKAEELGLTRVFFSDPYPFEQYCAIASEADAQIISLSASSTFEMTIPGKVQTCLALGTPILASVTGDAKKVLTQSGSAWLASPGNETEIVEIIMSGYLTERIKLKEMGEKGRKFYFENMGKERGVISLRDVLEKVLRGNSI
jgi:glycosyltransferase involved in cell wall biosynthesis